MSAQFHDFPKQKLPPLPENMAQVYARLITSTFAGPSRHAVCKTAARMLGCSPDTVERLLNGVTTKADARVILAALVLHEHHTGKPFTIAPGLAARLISDFGPLAR